MPTLRNPGFSAMLESLVRLVEHQSPAMRCSILLLDEDGVTLRHGAAPRLPKDYCDAIDGLRIGPGVGSCGTAAFTRETTIVGDIATHQYWDAFRDLALGAGLRACWSTPVLSAGGQCLGTFAMYYDEPREPSADDLQVITTAALLGGALIERERLHAESDDHRTALAEANAALEEQQVELELVNQQLQENAAELEVQAEALEIANQELRASEERIRDVFEQSPVAIAVLTGPQHVFELASPRFREYIGHRDIVGKPIREALPELLVQDTLEILDRIYATGESYQADERLVLLDRNGDGFPEEYYFTIGYTPLRSADGRVYAIASASLDVTDQVMARRDLEIARAEAEQANRAKSEFLATMSHELRTPLNAIGGYADLLLAGIRGELTPEQLSDVSRMKRSGEHLLGLINDILNFAKLEAGRVEFHLEDLTVAPLLQSLEELVRPQVDTKTLSYSQSLAAGDLRVRGDAEKVRQVLLNLVTNAVKFTEPGGHIGVECECDDDCVRIHVKDTGRGIPQDQLPRIFDPFVQVDRERTPSSQQGVGLGLSISRDLAQAMGGSLTAASQPGQGSTFTLTLPRPGVAIADRPTASSNTASV